MRLGRATLAVLLVALAASLAAIALYVFIHHPVLTDCRTGNPVRGFTGPLGDGVFCRGQERPGWVEPVALALVALAAAAVVARLLSPSRKYFAKRS